jgi:hypothetical protein
MLALTLVQFYLKHSPASWSWLRGLLWGLQLGGGIYLGVYGHRLAWRKRRFVSVRQFEDTMGSWNAWGMWLFIVSIGLVVALTVYSIATRQFRWPWG